MPNEGQSIARRVDGVDTDDSHKDFGVAGIPSPGEANPELLCVPSDGSVVLNEVLADPEGDDTEAKAEWIELDTPVDDYNARVAAAQRAEGRIASEGGPDRRITGSTEAPK